MAFFSRRPPSYITQSGLAPLLSRLFTKAASIGNFVFVAGRVEFPRAQLAESRAPEKERKRPKISGYSDVFPAVDKPTWLAYRFLVFLIGGHDTMAYFELQPAEADLQQLSEQYWLEAGEREKQLETAAFEAGEAIRGGEYTLPNLETIVRWKSERVVHYLIGNSSESIKNALAVAASPDARQRMPSRRWSHCAASTSRLPLRFWPPSIRPLCGARLSRLGGIGPRTARRRVLCRIQLTIASGLAECGMVRPKERLPAPTALHALERALLAMVAEPQEWTRGPS